MADGDDLVARSHGDREEREMQRGRRARHGAGVRRSDRGGEGGLEGGDLRPLRHPAGEDRRARGLGLFLAEVRARDRDEGARLLSIGRRLLPDPVLLQLLAQQLLR